MPHNKTGPRGLPGVQGPPGPRGHTGRTGPQGRTGETGLRGARGERGATGSSGGVGRAGPRGLQGREPAWRKKLIDDVQQQVERIDRELNIQMKRMSQIQQDLDHLRVKLQQLSDSKR